MMRFPSLQTLWEDTLYCIFPDICLMCYAGLEFRETYMCTDCRFHLPRQEGHLYADNELFERLYPRLPITSASAFLRFSAKSRVQKLLHQIKYKNRSDLAIYMGKWYAEEWLLEAPFPFDAIVPVPLHPKKLKLRGYNQAECIAQGLSEVTKCPVRAHILERVSHTSSLTSLGKLARWERIQGQYALGKDTSIHDLHLLLVDDVVTSGATLEACILALEKGAPKAISIAALASVIPK